MAEAPNPLDQLAEFQQARSDYLTRTNSNPQVNSPAPQFSQPPLVSPDSYYKKSLDTASRSEPYADPGLYTFDTGEGNKDFNRYAQSSEFKNLGYIPYDPEQENRYHQQQSALSRLGNVGVNLVNKTAAYTLQNFGLVLGAPVALLTNDVSKMTDNFAVRAADVIKDYTQDHFPIYKGDQYTKGSIWDKLASTDWWYDDANDRIALTLGMFAPTIVAALLGPEEAGAAAIATAGSEAAGGIGIKSLIAPFLAKLAKNPQIFSTIGKSVIPKMLSAATGSELGISEALAKYAPTLSYGEATAWNIIGQSGLNGSETQAAIKKSLTEKRVGGDPNFANLSDEDIKQRAAEGARNSFWETMPVALAGSFLEVPAMFGATKGFSSLLNASFNAKTAEQVLKPLAPSLLKAGAIDIMTGIEHGQNEAAQVAISNYNEKRAAGENVKGTLPGLFGEFMDHRSDPNFQNNEALGTIQGFIMGLGGNIKARVSGQYKAQEEQRQNLLNIQNTDRFARRLWTADLNQKDENGNTRIGIDGKPLIRPDKVVETALSLAGTEKNLAYKKALLDQSVNDPKNVHLYRDEIDRLDRENLTGFAHSFFFDPQGMKHLKGWMALERDNQIKNNPSFEQDNGITPEQQYQKNLKTIKELKEIHDQTFEHSHSVQDLGPVDSDKQKYIPDFLATNRFSQYIQSSYQHFYNEKLQDTNSELSRIQGKLKITPDLDDKGNQILKHFKNPSSVDEVLYNNLLDKKPRLEAGLNTARENYRTLTNKKELREAFDLHVAKGKVNEEKAKIQTEALNAPKPVEPAPTITPAATPSQIASNEPTEVSPEQHQILKQRYDELNKERASLGEHSLPEYNTWVKESPQAQDIIGIQPSQTPLAPITQALPKTVSIPVEYTPEARTQTFGRWDGDKEEKYEPWIVNTIRTPSQRDVTPGFTSKEDDGNGESLNDFAKRNMNLINRVFEKEPNYTAISTSSSFIKMALAGEKGGFDFDKIDWKKFEMFQTKNGEVYPIQKGDKTIFLVRHGETDDNKEKNLRSPDTSLTEKGKRDIVKAYNWFTHPETRQKPEEGETDWRKMPAIIPAKIISSDFLRHRQTTEGLVDLFKSKPSIGILNEFKGKIVYMSSGTGKSTMAKKYPDQVIDGDRLLYDFLKDKDIPVTSIQKSGLDFHKYLDKHKIVAQDLIAEFQNRALQSVKEGKILLTASKYLRPIAEKVYLSPGAERAAQVFKERGEIGSERSAANLFRTEQEEFKGRETFPIDKNLYAEDILTGKESEAPIEQTYLEKASQAKDLEELEQFRKSLTNDIINGKLDDKQADDLIANRKRELILDVSPESMHEGTILVMTDKNFYRGKGLAQVVSKTENSIKVKPWTIVQNNRIPTYTREISIDQIKSQVAMIYRKGITDEDINRPISAVDEAVSKDNLPVPNQPLDQELVNKISKMSDEELTDYLKTIKDCPPSP